VLNFSAKDRAVRVVTVKSSPHLVDTNSKTINKATTRLLEVLSAFIVLREPATLTEITKRLGMTKNMVYRALSVLTAEGYLVRDDRRPRYSLGPRILELQNLKFAQLDFPAIARKHLHAIHALTGETVQLSVRSGDVQTLVDGIEGRGYGVLRRKLGRAIPLHASAASRAILATMEDTEIAAYVERNAPLERFTERTLVDLDALLKDAAEIRRRGYALGMGDYNQGTFSVSFAVVGADDQAHGAVTIGGPLYRFTAERAEALLPTITQAIEELRAVATLYDVEA
jgi:DNA-binding IclR family transcriptional regulator